MNLKNKKDYDFANSKALFVMKIIAMSFGILTCVVVATAMLTRWITDINRSVKESQTTIAKAKARLGKHRKSRIKHILKQRKMQLKEERANKKNRGEENDSIYDFGGDLDLGFSGFGDLEDIEDIDEINEMEDEEMGDFGEFSDVNDLSALDGLDE